MLKKPLVIAIIGLLIIAHPVKAQTSLDYYKSLFNSWGLLIDTLPQKNTKLDTPATKKDLEIVLRVIEGGETDQKLTEENTVSTNKEGRYLLLLASQSQIKPQDSVGWINIIVVCDSLETAALPPGVSCASNNLDLGNQNPAEASMSAKILQTIQPVSVNGVNYYLLSQVLLVTPRYQKYLGNYFKALSRARASANVSDTVKIADSRSRELFKTFKDSSIFESTIYALVLVLFIVALRKPILIIVNNPRRLLEKNLYLDQTLRAVNFLTKHTGIIAFIFLILAIFYIPIFYVLTIKAGQIGDPTYPIKYISATVNPLNIPNYLTSQNLFRVGLLFFHYILALFGLLLILPSLVKVFTKSAQKITTTKFKVNFLKWLIPVTIVLNGLLLAFGDLKALTGFLALSVIILLLSLLYLKSRPIDYPNLFSKKERQLAILAMFTILALNIFYPLLQKSLPINYAYEPLIGIKDEVVVFPYSKQWGKNVLFDPYYYTGNSKVYADSYLIYSPNAERIVNKPLDKFSTAGSFTVVSRKPNKVFETLLKNPDLLDYISTTDFSPLFMLNTTSFNTTVKTQISFNCNYAPAPAVVKLETRTLNKFAQNNTDVIDPVTTESAELMDFPGCKTDTGLETFEVSLDPYTLPQDFAVLRIRGVDTKYLTALKLFVAEKEVPLTFINPEILDESHYKILYALSNPTKELTNYATEVKKDFQADIKTTDQGFDLSVPINELIRTGVLHNPFIIWTSQPNEIIKNAD